MDKILKKLIWPLVVLLLVAVMPDPGGAVSAAGSELSEGMLVSGGGLDAGGAEAFPEGVDEWTDSQEESDTGLDALLEEDLAEELETEEDLSAEEELLTSGGEGAVMVESAGLSKGRS